MKQAPHAFTLVEVMIVVAIIGIMASLALPGVAQYACRSKTAEGSGNLRFLFQSLSTAQSDIGGVGCGITLACDTFDGGHTTNTGVDPVLCGEYTVRVTSNTCSIAGPGFAWGAIGTTLRYSYAVTIAEDRTFIATATAIRPEIGNDTWRVTEANDIEHVISACQAIR